MAVADNVQFAAVLQAAAGVVKHLPGNMIGDRMLLMKRRVAEDGGEAVRLNIGQRVIHHKLAALEVIRHIGFDVQPAGSDRHIGLIGKHHPGVRV